MSTNPLHRLAEMRASIRAFPYSFPEAGWTYQIETSDLKRRAYATSFHVGATEVNTSPDVFSDKLSAALSELQQRVNAADSTHPQPVDPALAAFVDRIAN